jgi:hypothetical protein
MSKTLKEKFTKINTGKLSKDLYNVPRTELFGRMILVLLYDNTDRYVAFWSTPSIPTFDNEIPNSTQITSTRQFATSSVIDKENIFVNQEGNMIATPRGTVTDVKLETTPTETTNLENSVNLTLSNLKIDVSLNKSCDIKKGNKATVEIFGLTDSTFDLIHDRFWSEVTTVKFDDIPKFRFPDEKKRKPFSFSKVAIYMNGLRDIDDVASAETTLLNHNMVEIYSGDLITLNRDKLATKFECETCGRYLELPFYSIYETIVEDVKKQAKVLDRDKAKVKADKNKKLYQDMIYGKGKTAFANYSNIIKDIVSLIIDTDNKYYFELSTNYITDKLEKEFMQIFFESRSKDVKDIDPFELEKDSQVSNKQHIWYRRILKGTLREVLAKMSDVSYSDIYFDNDELIIKPKPFSTNSDDDLISIFTFNDQHSHWNINKFGSEEFLSSPNERLSFESGIISTKKTKVNEEGFDKNKIVINHILQSPLTNIGKLMLYHYYSHIPYGDVKGDNTKFGETKTKKLYEYYQIRDVKIEMSSHDMSKWTIELQGENPVFPASSVLKVFEQVYDYIEEN